MGVSREIIHVHLLRPDQVQALGGLCTYFESYNNLQRPLFIVYSADVPDRSERRRPPFARPLYWRPNSTNEPRPVRWAYQFGSHLVRTRTPASAELAEFCAAGVELLHRTRGQLSAKRFKVKEVPMALGRQGVTRAYLDEPLIRFRDQYAELQDMFNAEADSERLE